MQDSIEEVIRKMKKDKNNDPTKKIPDGFEEFTRTDGFLRFLDTTLDYNKELIRLERK